MKFAPLALAALLLAGCSGGSGDPPTGAGKGITEPGMDEVELGVPFYPGAKMTDNVDTPVQVGAEFTTEDGADKVIDFYKGKLPVQPSGSEFSYDKDRRHYSVKIQQKGAETHISISGHRMF
jgi:hypothetical protein